MRLFQHLDEKLQHMDRELATNLQYVQKVSYYNTDSNSRSPGLQDELSVKCVNGTLFLKKQGARVTKTHQRGLNIAAKETKW